MHYRHVTHPEVRDNTQGQHDEELHGPMYHGAHNHEDVRDNTKGDHPGKMYHGAENHENVKDNTGQ